MNVRALCVFTASPAASPFIQRPYERSVSRFFLRLCWWTLLHSTGTYSNWLGSRTNHPVVITIQSSAGWPVYYSVGRWKDTVGTLVNRPNMNWFNTTFHTLRTRVNNFLGEIMPVYTFLIFRSFHRIQWIQRINIKVLSFSCVFRALC